MKSIISQFHKIDLFGKPFIFEENTHNKYTTIGGLCFTVLIIIVCIVIGFLFGKEIYQRKAPVVISSDNKIAVSRVNTTEIPIFFGFIDSNVKNVPYARDYIKMELTLLTVSEDLQTKIYTYPGFKVCTADDFGEQYRPYVETSLNMGVDLYCINHDDMYFQNDFGSANSALINVRFVKCNPAKYDDCGQDEELYKTMIQRFSIMTVIIDSFADPNSYTDPFNYFITNKALKMSETFFQRSFLNIERKMLETNKGWLLDNTINEEYLSVRSIITEASESYGGNLFWVTISSPNIRNKTIRSYLKIQDLLAKIGGFFNALYILLLVVTKDYVDFSFYSHIYSHFIANSSNKPQSSNNFNLNASKKLVKNKATIDKVVQKLIISNYSQQSQLQNNSRLNQSIMVERENVILNNNIHNNNKNDNNSNNINIHKDYNSKINSNSSNNNNNANNNNSNKNEVSKNCLINNLVSNNINSNVSHTSNRNFHNFNILNTKNNILNNNNNILNNDINNNSNLLNKNSNNQLNAKKEATPKLSNKNIIKMLDSENIRNPLHYLDSINRVTNEIATTPVNFQEKTPSKNEITYANYVWNDFLCCRDKFFYLKKAVSRIISFNNLIELSYDHFLTIEELSDN